MSKLFTRRKLITTGLATVAGAAGLDVAARIADHYGLIPPDHYGIYGLGETLTYAAQRILTAYHPLAREFSRSQITPNPLVNGLPPKTQLYQSLLHNHFVDWRLGVDGLVARPASFSLAELKSFPSHSHITHQACEEGWSFIAEWTGVQLSYVLNRVGVSERARYVVLYPMDDGFDSIDLADAFHPQTLLAYGMNGKDLPTGHGAPVRLKLTRQLGYKSVKYLSRISVVDSVKSISKGLGATAPEYDYSWYAGI